MIKIYQKQVLVFFATIFMIISCHSQILHLTVMQNCIEKEICELDYEMANISNKLYTEFNENTQREDLWLDITDVLELTDITTLIDVFFPLMYESSVVINEQVSSENYQIDTTIAKLNKSTKQYYSSDDTIASIALLADYFDIHEIKLIALMKIIQRLFKPDASIERYLEALDKFHQESFLKALYFIQHKKALRNSFFDLITQYIEHTQATWQICESDSAIEIINIELINNGMFVVIHFNDGKIKIGNLLDQSLSKRLSIKLPGVSDNLLTQSLGKKLSIKLSDIICSASSHNGERILVGYKNNVSILRKRKKVKNFTEYKTLTMPESVKLIVVDEMKEQIKIITDNNNIYIYDLESYYDQEEKLESFSYNVHKVMISADKKSILIQKNIKIIDDETGNHSLYCLLSDLKQRQILQNQVS